MPIQNSSQRQPNRRLKLVGFGCIVPLGLAIFLVPVIDKQIRMPGLWQTVDAAEEQKESSVSIQTLQELAKAGKSLQDIPLSGIDLSEADLSHVNFSGSNLSSANLSSANLSGADLSGADLRDADLGHADLGYANLSETNLSRTNLTRTNFRYADLSDALFGSANLTDSYFSGANFGQVVNSYRQQIKSACYWQMAIYKVDQNGDFDKRANEKFINDLKQDVASNPKEPLDCGKWKN